MTPPDTDDDGPRSDPVQRTVRDERSLTPMRKTIAERLSESYRNAVHVTVGRDIHADPLLDAAESAGQTHDVDVSFVDVLLPVVSDALDAHPAFNATFEDETHRLYEEHNVGIAVALDQGLVTPVLPAIGEKTLEEIARERDALTGRVRAGEYSMSDFEGGTFTISNLGPLGTDSFTPVIDPPQVAILGVNSIRERPAVVDGEVEPRRECRLDLSFDHRIVDGADAARFLDAIATAITDRHG